jgi:hypothetical protein
MRCRILSFTVMLKRSTYSNDLNGSFNTVIRAYEAFGLDRLVWFVFLDDIGAGEK